MAQKQHKKHTQSLEQQKWLYCQIKQKNKLFGCYELFYFLYLYQMLSILFS